MTTTNVATAQRYGGRSCEVSVIDSGLVSELAAAGHHHGEAMAIGRLDDFRVPHGAAGLDDGRDARAGGELDVVGEGEKAVGRDDGAGGVVSRLARLVDGEEHAVHPAHLTRADADRRLLPGQEDG